MTNYFIFAHVSAKVLLAPESSCIRSFIIKGPKIHTLNVYSNPITIYVYPEQGENADITYATEHFVSITNYYKLLQIITNYYKL